MRGEKKGVCVRKKRVCKEDGAGMGRKRAQAKLACRPASARLNTGDVVVGCPRFPTIPHGISVWCNSNHRLGLKPHGNPVGVIQTTYFILKPYGISVWCNSNHRLGLNPYGKSSWCYPNHSFRTQTIWYICLV